MIKKMGYRWNLRKLMADREMFQTTDLVPLLAERGVTLSREQVFRLVTQPPQRMSMDTLAALCDILDCQPNDLIEVQVVNEEVRKTAAWRDAQPAPGRAPDLDPATGGSVTAPSPTAPSIVARLAAQAARMEAATNAAVGQVTKALPTLSTADANAVLETAVPIPVRGAARFLEELAEHMATHPDALTSGSSLCPPVLLRLAEVLHEAGHPVVRPGCARCGKIRSDLRQLRPEEQALRFMRRTKPQARNLRTLPPRRPARHCPAPRGPNLPPLLPRGPRHVRGVRRLRPAPTPGGTTRRRPRAVHEVLETPGTYLRQLRKVRSRCPR